MDDPGVKQQIGGDVCNNRAYDTAGNAQTGSQQYGKGEVNDDAGHRPEFQFLKKTHCIVEASAVMGLSGGEKFNTDQDGKGSIDGGSIYRPGGNHKGTSKP